MKLPRHNGRGASGIDERLSTLKLSRAVLVENSGKKGKASHGQGSSGGCGGLCWLAGPMLTSLVSSEPTLVAQGPSQMRSEGSSACET